MSLLNLMFKSISLHKISGITLQSAHKNMVGPSDGSNFQNLVSYLSNSWCGVQPPFHPLCLNVYNGYYQIRDPGMGICSWGVFWEEYIWLIGVCSRLPERKLIRNPPCTLVCLEQQEISWCCQNTWSLTKLWEKRYLVIPWMSSGVKWVPTISRICLFMLSLVVSDDLATFCLSCTSIDLGSILVAMWFGFWKFLM